MALSALCACTGDAALPLPGTPLTVESAVLTVTFDHRPVGEDFDLLGDRYLLLRWPSGARLGDPDLILRKEWGLALHLTAADASDPNFYLPEVGDTVRASGTFVYGSWNGHTLPMLEQVTELTVLHGRPPRRALGERCRADMECRDNLICARDTERCSPTPQPVSWDSDWHNLNGACATDSDCPLGQFCDLRYTIPSRGPYAPGHRPQDVGSHLCALEPTATRQSLCPAVDTVADLLGGRYTQGKEVCIRGHVFIQVPVEDGDIHAQMIIDHPLRYPATDPPLWLVAAPTETTAPYRDPARPQGALGAPPLGDVVVFGTYRFDVGHGWFEVHPVKAWWTAP
ncbi:MAG TPA: hypothetical protein VH877_11030 [Polyangia bacterium]|nr:hypothetical protein [Polyangia bacterium]